MPFRRKDLVTDVSSGYTTIFVGPIDHTQAISVDLAALTAAEIDEKGWVKPGVPLTIAGALVGAGPATVYGVTIEPTKVADDNAAPTIAALGVIQLAVAVIALVNRDIAEDLLGRAYTAAELTGFGSSLVRLTPT